MDNTNLTLITLPAEKNIIDNLIAETKSSIMISRQSVSSQEFCDLLFRLKNKGIQIKILLSDARYFRFNNVEHISAHHQIDPHFVQYSKESLTLKEHYIYLLNQGGIYPHFINHNKVFLNHSKFMIFDSKILYLGSASGGGNQARLDIGMISKVPSHIKIFQDLFYSDFDNHEFVQTKSDDIAIAPYNMIEIIKNVLLHATKDIYLMFPVMTDNDEIFNIIEQKLLQGIKVYGILSPDIFPDSSIKMLDNFRKRKLLKIGAHFKVNYIPIIHSKCIIVDPHDKQLQKVFIGSGNLRTSSLMHSREVGITTSKSEIVDRLFLLFEELCGVSVDY